MQAELIARVCHEANRSYCHSIGDFSQLAWEYAPEWQKQSAIKGVEFVIENPQAGDSAQHDSWMRQKLKDGWIWGPIKDEASKTHPCMVPFSQLPVEQQLKDKLFREIVITMSSFV